MKILDGDEIVANHALVAPGEASITDDHFGGARPDRPRRAIRPVTDAEKAFCALGPAAERSSWRGRGGSHPSGG